MYVNLCAFIFLCSTWEAEVLPQACSYAQRYFLNFLLAAAVLSCFKSSGNHIVWNKRTKRTQTTSVCTPCHILCQFECYCKPFSMFTEANYSRTTTRAPSFPQVLHTFHFQQKCRKFVKLVSWQVMQIYIMYIDKGSISVKY